MSDISLPKIHKNKLHGQVTNESFCELPWTLKPFFYYKINMKYEKTDKRYRNSQQQPPTHVIFPFIVNKLT